MLDQHELFTLVRQHGLDATSLRPFAHFDDGSAYLPRETSLAAFEAWRMLTGLVQVMGY